MSNPPLEVLVLRLDSLAHDMTDIKATLKTLAADVSTLVSRLAVIEERQGNDRKAITRAFEELADCRKRISDLEASQPLQKQSSEWVQKAVWAGIAALLGVVLSGALRFGRSDMPIGQSAPAVIERKQGRDE